MLAYQLALGWHLLLRVSLFWHGEGNDTGNQKL